MRRHFLPVKLLACDDILFTRETVNVLLAELESNQLEEIIFPDGFFWKVDVDMHHIVPVIANLLYSNFIQQQASNFRLFNLPLPMTYFWFTALAHLPLELYNHIWRHADSQVYLEFADLHAWLHSERTAEMRYATSDMVSFLPLAATDVIKAIALIFLTSSYEESHTLNAPLTRFIQNGHHKSASWTKTIFKNTARSSALDFFKTESVALLQYSWNSLLTVLLRGSGNSSRIFGCSNVKFATVFHFFLHRFTMIDFVLSWNELNVSTRPPGLTITTLASVLELSSKSSTFRYEQKFASFLRLVVCCV